MHRLVHLRMIQRVANLAGNVLQVPYGKAVAPGERSCHRNSLHIFHGSEQQIALIADAV